MTPATMPQRPRLLVADCGSCFGLCCVALPFARSADFPIDKPAGVPCPNLAVDHHCTIHAELRPREFAGCTAYDCFGAGQQVSQYTFAGRDWRTHPEIAPAMFAALPVMRALHELLVLIEDADSRTLLPPLADEVRVAGAEVRRLTDRPAEEVLSIDVTAHRQAVGDLLNRVSAAVRLGPGQGQPRNARHADLAGADLHNTDLRRADLRGALLIGTDLRAADLRGADLLGADLRGANLSGADLTGALFLTAPQLATARGDDGTVLPPHLRRPAQWSPPGAGRVARNTSRRTS